MKKTVVVRYTLWQAWHKAVPSMNSLRPPYNGFTSGID